MHLPSKCLLIPDVSSFPSKSLTHSICTKTHKIMDLLANVQLIKADGSEHSADSILGKAEIICFYFSAHWCPPCRAFTPVLKDFYEEAAEQGVEIIFVSSDRSLEDQISYMKSSHGNWAAIKFGNDIAPALKKKFEISGIPALIVINKKTGSIITKQGRNDIQSKGPGCIDMWKSQ
ncbi:nucleoredoxin-like protein 2 isoform X1 [Lepeophtheirus salmonis]|uniref:nucleoredoxin-like protein 2 isoform X1 n=1 Tax=Lepeophtheirus salmonis TaxID=72036 RepID=UPI001AEAEB85|nr:nucleoredoxin-like protein 2 isoform X1 [Lepeophtheirus salmonis]